MADLTTTAPISTGSRMPRPYQEEEFADRASVLKLIEERLRDGRAQRPMRQPVILFWGVHGVGKSWLLGHIQHLHAFTSPDPARSQKGVFAVLADFADLDPNPACLAQILSQMVKQIAEQVGDKYLAPVREVDRRFRQVATVGGNANESLAKAFTEFILALTSDFVPILLFDTVDLLESRDEGFFFWFEEHVIAPVVRKDQVLVILGSRRELHRWRQFEVRRRIKQEELQTFDRATTVEQVRKRGVQEYRATGETIYPYSYGHPLATWFLHQGLEQLRKEDQPFDREFIETREQTVADLLMEVEELLLQGVDDSLRLRLSFTATLRRFHIKSLQLLLADLEQDDSLLSKPDSHFQELITGMVTTNLARWSSPHHSYIIDPTIRHIINRHLLLQNRIEYRRRHGTALHLYEQWMREIPLNCGTFLIEALYHQAALAHSDEALYEKFGEAVDNLLSKALDKKNFNLEGVNELSEELSRDDELRELLGQQFERVMESIVNLHRQFP